MLKKTMELFGEKIWKIRVADLPRLKAVPLTLVRVVVLTLRLFVKNKCSLRASALTFYTLLSIVPIAALIFGIGKSFGYDEQLKEKLRESLVGHEAVADKIITFADSTLQTTSRGIIAGIGVLILIWTALKLLASIENAFNDIWGIKQGRSWIRKLSDYLTMLVICPFLVIVVGSATIFVTAQLNGAAEILPFTETVNRMIELGSRTIPFIASWLIFTFIYIFMPNTKVKFSAALPAGLFAGTLYLIVQSLYIFLQAKLTSYNAIYGSFAALPFFLIGLQVSWTLVLMGAQLSFAFQNVSIYELAPGDGPISTTQKALYSLRIMRQLAMAFESGKGPLSDVLLSQHLEIPIRTTRSVLFELVSAKLITEIQATKKDDALYQVAIPTEELTPTRILRALADLGEAENTPEPDSSQYMKLLDQIWKSAAASPGNRPVSKL